MRGVGRRVPRYGQLGVRICMLPFRRVCHRKDMFFLVVLLFLLSLRNLETWRIETFFFPLASAQVFGTFSPIREGLNERCS
jgi:hypothetical protein